MITIDYLGKLIEVPINVWNDFEEEQEGKLAFLGDDTDIVLDEEGYGILVDISKTSEIGAKIISELESTIGAAYDESQHPRDPNTGQWTDTDGVPRTDASPIAAPKGKTSTSRTLFHGSDVKIDKFDISKVTKWNKFGHFFTSDEGFATSFGTVVNKAEVDIKKPKTISTSQWNNIRGEHAKDAEWFSSWKEELKGKGYDGLHILGSEEQFAGQTVKNPEIFVAFEDSQIDTGAQGTAAPTGLKKTSVKEAGYTFESGKPVTFTFLRNTERAFKHPDPTRYGQNLEPKGRYMVLDAQPEFTKRRELPNIEQGTITFENPLVIENVTTSSASEGWKSRLSQEYDGKTGTQLTKALIKNGFDGVITVDGDHTSEIVALPRKPKPKSTRGAAFDPSQPRDPETGEWISGTGTQEIAAPKEPGLKSPAEPKKIPHKNEVGRIYDSELKAADGNDDAWLAVRQKQRAEEDKWTQDIQVELSMGRMSEKDAETLGWHNRYGGQPMKPMPKDLFHVTTAKDAVMATGLKTRVELGQEQGKGLGGGASDTISFTTDPELAESLKTTLIEAHGVASGKITIDDLIQNASTGSDAKKPYWTELKKYVEDSEGKDYFESIRTGKEIRIDFLGKTPEQMNSFWGDGEYVPLGEGREWEGVTRYKEFEHILTSDQVKERTFKVYKTIGTFRESAGGAMNPIFFASDVKGLAAIDPTQIDTIHVNPEPGAQGYQVDALGEWRTFTGKAVKVVKETQPPQEEDAFKGYLKVFHGTNIDFKDDPKEGLWLTESERQASAHGKYIKEFYIKPENTVDLRSNPSYKFDPLKGEPDFKLEHKIGFQEAPSWKQITGKIYTDRGVKG